MKQEKRILSIWKNVFCEMTIGKTSMIIYEPEKRLQFEKPTFEHLGKT